MTQRPTNYWIIVACKEHVKIGEAGGFAQACHGKAAPLKKMKRDDYVIYYSSKLYFNQTDKCQAFTAIGRVKDDQVYQVELSPNFRPFRIDIDFFPSKSVSILPLIENLTFIQNKRKWGYPFRWGTLAINETDFQLIAGYMLDDTRD